MIPQINGDNILEFAECWVRLGKFEMLNRNKKFLKKIKSLWPLCLYR